MQRFKEEVKAYLHQHIKTNARLEQTHHDTWSWMPDPDRKLYLLVLHSINESAHTHLDKIAEYESDSNLKVVHLWEDLWQFHQKKVESRLLSLFGKSTRIHGRQTKIESINNDVLISFLSKNHLNVPIKAKYKYGLFHQKELVAIMSFSKSRIIERKGKDYHSYELLRFCNKLNHTVVGGFSKLLDHFIKQECPEDIMTYIDRDWSDGATYEQYGFDLEGKIPPMEFILNLKTGERLYPERIRSNNWEDSSDFTSVFNSGSLKYVKLFK